MVKGEASLKETGKERGGQIPDYLDELAHVHVVRHQELGLVQDGQLLLPLVSLLEKAAGPRKRLPLTLLFCFKSLLGRKMSK